MFVRLLALLLLLASPLMAVDYDTLFYGDIEDASIQLNSTIKFSEGYRNYGAYPLLEFFESATQQKRGMFRFSISGLDQVPDTNAVVDAKLYVKSTFLAIPAYLKVYALRSDSGWVEGARQGSIYDYGHEGVSWYAPNQPHYPDTATGTLPARFDWRDSNIVTTVKNQGGCGSCWAHALIAVVESAHKKDVITYTITQNSEDGTGADRTAAPLLTPSPEVTGTGWEVRPLPAWLMNQWNRQTGTDNGLVFIADSGSININTTENGTNAPRIWLNCVTIDKTTGLYADDIKIRIAGTGDLFDACINDSAPTTNYSASDTARIDSRRNYVLRVDSLRQVLVDALSAANDTVVEILSATCSLYVSTKYANASMRGCNLLKSKFIEDSVTWNQYRMNLEWGAGGASKPDQLDLSEQQLVSCVTGTDCSNGGDVVSAMDYARADSIYSEAAFRYAGSEIACLDTFGLANQAIVEWAWHIPSATERALKQALMLQPLIGVHALSTNPSFYTYVQSSSNTCWYSNANNDGSHAVELIGWNDNDTCDLDGGIGTWIIKNQYGSTWGQDGFANVAKTGYTNFTSYQEGENSSVVISVTEDVPMWSTGGLIGGTEVTGVVAATPTLTADAWNAITIPAWVIRAMINGNMSRTILIQAEPNAAAGFIVNSTEATSAGDRPYLVLKSLPQSQVATKIGNAKIGNSKIGE